MYGTGDVYVNLPLTITAGEGAPDICTIENTRMKSFIDMGGLLDITDKIQPYIDNLAPNKVADVEMDGKYYGVPWEGGPGRLWEMLLWQRGLGYIDDEGKVSINSPGHVECLEFIGKMVSEGLFADTVDWTDEWYAQFSSTGKTGEPAPVASHIEASWMGGCFKSWICPDTAGLWGLVPMPAWEEGGVRASSDTGDSIIIPEQCQNPEAAWALLEYALLRDQSVINCYIAGGYTPSLLSSLDSDVFKMKDPFYGDQAIGLVFNDIVPNIPEANIYITEYAEVVNLFVPEICKYLTGEKSAQEALDDAAAAIRSATGRQ